MDEQPQLSGARSEANPHLPRIDVSQWFQHSPEVLLVFQGVEYRLRQTRSKKLILTK